ncbi:dihydrolipoyl dehydrogenase family protein [Cryptosporangium arvum]|uniref:dihydrolipoyl dehydrogenase family protein n=1 Tax=Cryptosporangium arvum TaxID=80871 RepID=UPI0004B8B83C|nr:NAD(P)/FAD-dependent oxidoreductase [Cryptosporangium arvum]
MAVSGGDEYDVIVVGAGPVGENVADQVVRGGLSAVVVERELVGGECSYWACIPSKALLRPAAALADARRVDGAATAVRGGPNPEQVLARRTGFTSNWSDDSQVGWLDSAGIALVRGTARLVGERQVEIRTRDGGSRRVTARQAVVIATGSKPAVPDLPGLAEADPWTSRDATSATAVPDELAVLGGGVVGCEMATAFASLGSRVTVIARGGSLLPRFEPFVGELVLTGLRSAGVDVRLGATVSAVERDEVGVRIELADADATRAVRADEILVATGRVPAVDGLGLEVAGFSGLQVDDSCRVVGVDWLYAAGDVNGRALLTHMGKYQARACGAAIVARAGGDAAEPTPWSPYAATADHAAVPQAVFTDPEVGAVGLTEAEARDAGRPVRAVEYDLAQVAGASLFADGYLGRAKLVIDVEREVIVGATFVGATAAELVHAATIAIVGEVPLARLWHAVPSFPTISEVWLRLLEAAAQPPKS